MKKKFWFKLYKTAVKHKWSPLVRGWIFDRWLEAKKSK